MFEKDDALYPFGQLGSSGLDLRSRSGTTAAVLSRKRCHWLISGCKSVNGAAV